MVLAASNDLGPEPAELSDLNAIFENVVGLIIPFAGIAFFLIVIVGGFKWLTAGGDPAKAQGARNTITWGVLGIIFLALAYLILYFIEVITGAPVTVFNVVYP